MFKQQNPCSNHEVHVLFEHVIDLKILKTGTAYLHDFMQR